MRIEGKIGLAAGFAKDMITANLLMELGFDFVELGTFTLFPSSGHSYPRVTLTDDGLFNKMGFPNRGIISMCEELSHLPPIKPIGISVSGIYAKQLIPMLDDFNLEYIAVNVSSPNTKGIGEVSFCEIMHHRHKTPIFLKVNPDQIDRALMCKPDGLIICNTESGYSGQKQIARTIDAIIYTRDKSDIFIIGCGGVWSKKDAEAILRVGANSVQLLTGWLYKGLQVLK